MIKQNLPTTKAILFEASKIAPDFFYGNLAATIYGWESEASKKAREIPVYSETFQFPIEGVSSEWSLTELQEYVESLVTAQWNPPVEKGGSNG